MPLGGGESDVSWPTLDELKTKLDVTKTDAHDGELESFLAAAISWVKVSVGGWDELTDMPNEELAGAALARAVELATNDISPRSDRISTRMLYDQRTRFPIS